MPKTIETTIYRLSELPIKLQNNIINEEQQMFHETMDFSYDIEAFCNYLRETTPFVVFADQVHFSLSYSQSDGASFTGEINGSKLNPILDQAFNQSEKAFLLSYLEDIDLRIIRLSSMCTHERSVQLTWNCYYCKFLNERLEKSFNYLLSILIYKLDELRIKLCRELEQNLYNIIEYNTNEERIKEHLADCWYSEKGQFTQCD